MSIMRKVFVYSRHIGKTTQKDCKGDIMNYFAYCSCSANNQVNFIDKNSLIASGILGTNLKPKDFWQMVKDRETKINARFAHEYIVEVPYSLIEKLGEASKQVINLCKDIASALTQDNGKSNNRVVNWFFHKPDNNDFEGDPRNYHIHMLMSEREVVNNVLSQTKQRSWDKKLMIAIHKKRIGDVINKVLSREQLEKIDTRTQKEIEKDNPNCEKPRKRLSKRAYYTRRRVNEQLDEIQKEIDNIVNIDKPRAEKEYTQIKILRNLKSKEMSNEYNKTKGRIDRTSQTNVIGFSGHTNRDIKRDSKSSNICRTDQQESTRDNVGTSDINREFEQWKRDRQQEREDAERRRLERLKQSNTARDESKQGIIFQPSKSSNRTDRQQDNSVISTNRKKHKRNFDWGY